MGDAYAKEKKFALAALYYKKATDQAAANTVRTMKTGSILNYLKYDEIKKKYVVAQEDLAVRQNYFMVVYGSCGYDYTDFYFPVPLAENEEKI